MVKTLVLFCHTHYGLRVHCAFAKALTLLWVHIISVVLCTLGVCSCDVAVESSVSILASVISVDAFANANAQCERALTGSSCLICRMLLNNLRSYQTRRLAATQRSKLTRVQS